MVALIIFKKQFSSQRQRNLMQINDTIVAQATPPGRGGVGILRISGTKLH